MASEDLADVAELADAQASGACALRGVEVRLLSSAVDVTVREWTVLVANMIAGVIQW